MVTDRAPGLATGQGPGRQQMAFRFLAKGQQTLHKIIYPGGLDEGQERMLGAERVPERKCAVILEFRRSMNLVVLAAISAVGVVVERRRDHRMVQCAVEGLPEIRIGGFDEDGRELLVPVLA